MARRYFIWNGVRSDNMHIIVNGRAPIIRPEERVNHLTIPGRCGELTQTEGDDIYNSYIQTVNVVIDDSARVREAELWLKGDGYVTFDTQPDRRQRARIINAVTFEKHSKNLDYYTGEIQFYCDPVKQALTEDDIEVTASGTVITNPGTLPAYPEIQIEGEGTVSIRVDDNALIIPDLTSGWVADCENKWILQNGVPQMNAWRGSFPVLTVGDNTIYITGQVTKLTITPHWRYL